MIEKPKFKVGEIVRLINKEICEVYKICFSKEISKYVYKVREHKFKTFLEGELEKVGIIENYVYRR